MIGDELCGNIARSHFTLISIFWDTIDREYYINNVLSKLNVLKLLSGGTSHKEVTFKCEYSFKATYNALLSYEKAWLL